MLSVSTAAKHYAKKTYSIDSVVLPNVIDYPRFHQAKPIRSHGKAINILFLGRLVPRKGCMVLLEAVKLVVQESGLTNFKVIICGKGPLMPKLQDYAQDHKLNTHVEFVGYVSELDKPGYYASADISVFPSNGGESFGIVLLEAMASGQAVVLGGDNSGYRSVLGDRPELLFDPKDSRELASKLELYLTDKAARQAMANWGSNYTKNFDIEVVGKKLIDIYSQALRKRFSQ
jgi:phosphatidylinositol alpha-mannosyltransferase